MAQVQVYFWKDIPYGVRARDEGGRVTRPLPKAFEATVDAAAMVDGQTEAAEYRAGFRWGEALERPGTAQEAADAMVQEIVNTYPPARLAKLARREAD